MKKLIILALLFASCKPATKEKDYKFCPESEQIELEKK
jgi:hypothetical protein